MTCKGDLQLGTCHSSSWTSFTRSFRLSLVHGRLVNNIQQIVVKVISYCPLNQKCLLWHFWVSVLELKIPTLVRHWDLLACLRHRAVWSLQVMRTYSWNSWRRVWISWKYLMGRTYQTLSFGQQDALVLWGQWPFWRILLVWEFCVMRCFGIVRTIPTSSSSWYPDHTSDLGLCVLSSSEATSFTLWIGYYSGRKTTAIQLYLADLHCECRTEHSVLHWGLKLWDAISMWRTDLEMELCIPTMFCIQKNVVQKTVYESLRSWRATRPV